MSAPLEITFHGLERSDAVEARIRDKFTRLQQHFERITHARVVVETPRKHSPTAKVFQVKIEIGLPGQKPLIVCHEPLVDGARTDVSLASQGGARLLLIGGPPFPETILMWWNFVARTPEEIRDARDDWENRRRFGDVTAYKGQRLHAPELVRLARPNPVS